ncbi:SecDF P1 head subdomain-containing protein [Cellulomonas hominis]
MADAVGPRGVRRPGLHRSHEPAARRRRRSGSIHSAAATQPTRFGQSPDEWVVDLELTSAGTRQLAATTTRLAGLSAPQNQFAIVLDRQVVSAPSVVAGVTTTTAQIAGSFTAQSAATLARQLGSGPLPVTLTLQSQGPIPASTPGS